MERLAKEKIAKQQQILVLRRELSSQLDQIDSTSGLLDGEMGNGTRERGMCHLHCFVGIKSLDRLEKRNNSFSAVPSESLSEPSILTNGGRARYNSTSSLSSAATASSPCTAGVPVSTTVIDSVAARTFELEVETDSIEFLCENFQLQSASISSVITSTTSPILIATTPSQQRAHSSSPTSIPLSLLSASVGNGAGKIIHLTDQHMTTSATPSTLKLTSVLQNGLNVNSNGLTGGITHNSQNHISINFTTAEGIAPALLTATQAAMPLNLNVNAIHGNGSIHQNGNMTGNSLQIINAIPKEFTSNGTTIKNGIRKQMIDVSEHHSALINGNIDGKDIKIESLATKIDSEPPTKVIKLINGSTIALASVDKDKLTIPSGHVTLSQVVVSQIPLLTSPQGLRVIGQAPNGLATIELSNPNGKLLCFRYPMRSEV